MNENIEERIRRRVTDGGGLRMCEALEMLERIDTLCVKSKKKDRALARKDAALRQIIDIQNQGHTRETQVEIVAMTALSDPPAKDPRDEEKL